MKVKSVIVGELNTNCYILEKNGKVLIIDPGSDFETIKTATSQKEVLKVLITHQHFDHINALYDIIKLYKVEKLDYLSAKEGKYEIGDFNFEVIYTPGHSDDSISFYFEKEKKMFVGDFVFKNTIGRCDLPTGNFKEMKQSIEKLKKYPSNITLYPGHGNSTILKDEIKSNPYF